MDARPDLPELYNDLGCIELERGDPEAAASYLRVALDIEESAVRRYNLGEALTAKGRHREAAQAFRRAVELGPERWEYQRAWANAVARLPMGSRAEALDTLAGWVRAGDLRRREARVLEAIIQHESHERPR